MLFADRSRFFCLAVAICALLTAPARSQSCADLAPRVDAALDGHDLGALAQAQQSLAACQPAEMARIGRMLAARIYNRAIAGPVPDDALLSASLQFGRTWQALATLGDMAFERKDWAVAARRLQEALVEIDDLDSTPAPPAKEVILALRRRAETASLLSPDYQPMPVTRSGGNGGLAAGVVRGIAIASVALPIQFQFDSDIFTASGQRAAEDLLRMVRNDRPLAREITLTGHTDTKGSPEYNDALSLRRAAAVRRFLQAKGVTARIEIAGMGKRRPYVPDDPGRYTEAERDQMNRRVEFRRQ